MDWPLVGRTDLLRSIRSAIEERPGSVVLDGALGVGKTRLVRHVADTLRAAEWHVEFCLCSEAGRSVPFGALSHLIPAHASADLLLMFEETRRAIMAKAGGARCLLVVDDAHHLDGASMALVHRLAVSPDASVLLSGRAGERGNDATITSLWKDDFARRFDVPPLTRAAHDQLADLAVGRVAAANLRDRLWQLTQGNPLFLTEVLRLIIERGAMAAPEIEHDMSASPRLARIVMSRFEHLPTEARTALRKVALAEPVRLDVVDQFCSREVLAELERRSVVVVEGVGGADHVRTAHPLYGVIARASLHGLERAALAGDVARALVSRPVRQPGDALKAAVCLLEAGERPPADLAVAAAGEALARADPELGERLARSAVEGAPSTSTFVALGTALSVQHKLEQANTALEQALQQTRTDDERVAAVLAWSRHRVWMERDVAGGAALLEQAISRLSDPSARSALRAELAIVSAVAGDARTAARVAADVLSDRSTHPRVALSALVQSTLAQTMLGRLDLVGEQLHRADALASELSADGPRAVDQLGITHAMWLQFVDLAEALNVAASGYERALREGGALGVWSLTFAELLADAGDLDAALGVAERAVTELDRYDPFHNMPMALSLTALIHALRGEMTVARERLTAAGSVGQTEPRTRVWVDRAEVWMAASMPDRAAALAVAAGDRACAGTMIAWSTLLYHDAVRLDRAALAVEPLRRVSRETSGAPLIELRSEHARALVERDLDALVRVADGFEEAGSPLLAAEALAQAAVRVGGARAARLTLRALRVKAACAGATTPPLRRLVPPLSQRETEIAELAASGASSREIADRLCLSVRTVDNHLASVYRKLSVGGREELANTFRPPGC